MTTLSPARSADYGPRARFGVAVPHANPTVEPELAVLWPAGVTAYATRLWHPSPRVEDRLRHYITHLDDALASFGPLALDAFGVGCTGSSYVAGPAEEDRLTAALAAARGLPVITAAQALRRVLEAAGARRIALVAPYPDWLAEAGESYWRAAGFDVVATRRVDPTLSDTHRIYELTSADALAAAREVALGGAEALVLSGTGMPTLGAVRVLAPILPIPVLSSNLSLAWALLATAAASLAPSHPSDLIPQGAPA